MADSIDKDNSRLCQFASSLLSALSGEGGRIQQIIDIGFDALENPVLVTDKSWRAIAMTDRAQVPADRDWQEFLTAGQLSADAVAAGIRDNMAERIEQSTGPFRWQSAEMAYPRVFYRLAVGDKTAGTISVVEVNRPFSPEDEPYLRLLGDAVATEMQKSRFQQYSKGMLYEDFIWNLLEKRLSDPQAIEERLKVLNLGIRKNVYVFVFDVREYDVRQYSVSYMRDQLEKMISGGQALLYDNKIVITASFSRARDIFRTELKNLSAFLKRYNIRCGISRRCTQLADLRFFYDQALDAMTVGTHMDADRYIYPYGEYAIYHAAKACLRQGALHKYCHPALTALIDHDREYNTAFVTSLTTFLKHFKNITNTANALHLHRSTMVYHIKRIEEIMDISLDNYHSVQQIEFSLRLMEYGKKLDRLEKWDDIPESDR